VRIPIPLCRNSATRQKLYQRGGKTVWF